QKDRQQPQPVMAPVAELLSSVGQIAERAVLEPTKTLITDAIFRRQQTTSGPVATVTVIQTQPASSSGSGDSQDKNNA
ncbi:hypothetical protein NPN18_26935, partial [Vibrio parahaemolyticus]|nr:hypothetical protein [Vibrio parahaemolyticus]